MRISDWSSDVCSSDLLMRLMRAAGAMKGESDYYEYANSAYMKGLPGEAKAVIDEGVAAKVLNPGKQTFAELSKLRSEERRVGKECVSKCRDWWWPER